MDTELKSREEADELLSRILVRVQPMTEWGERYEEIRVWPQEEVPEVMRTAAGSMYNDPVFTFSTVYGPVRSTLGTWKHAVMESERLGQGTPTVFWLELRKGGFHITLYWTRKP
jgi:hypothetical protein